MTSGLFLRAASALTSPGVGKRLLPLRLAQREKKVLTNQNFGFGICLKKLDDVKVSVSPAGSVNDEVSVGFM